MEIRETDIREILPYENNPRCNEQAVDAVANSIRDFGFKVPIIVDKDNVIIAGHTRLLAAQKLGMTRVPVLMADDLTEEQVKAFRLADNKVGEIATWDFSKLTKELEELANMEIDMTKFGFEEIFEEMKEPKEDDFDIESAMANEDEAKSKLGEVYQLGEHRLMCGDSTKKEDIDKLLEGNKCELTFTDPPYELDTQGGGILKGANSMKQIRENGVDSFDPSQLIIVSDTNIYCHNKPLIKKYIELAENNKMAYDLCFYKKENSVPNYKGHLMTDVEYIAIIGKQDPNKNLDMDIYSKCYIGKKDKDNTLSYSKPIGLCTKFIKLYAKKNVLDLFGGSGTTLIACEQLNKRCYMMEFNPKYVDVIIERWEQLTGKKAKLITEGE